MFPVHPHGIYCIPLNFSKFNQNSIYNKLQIIILASNPIHLSTPVDLWFKWAGFEEIGPESFKRLMKNKKNFSFLPGGFEEATITSNSEYRLIL